MKISVKNILKFLYNAKKFLKNYIRVKKLQLKGAQIGENVVVGAKCKVYNPAKLSIGKNVYIGENFFADCSGGVSINDGTIISNNCTIMTYNHDYLNEYFVPYGPDNIEKKVTIENNCWIGINVNICPGVTIKENSVVGMGTTVSKNIESDIIYAGGRVIREKPQCGSRKKYSLLEVRTVYNPIHYLCFQAAVSKYIRHKNPQVKGTIPFELIHDLYKGTDYLSLIYQYCSFRKLTIDFSEGCIML